MPNRLIFETSSNGVDQALAKNLLDAALNWTNADPDRDLSRFDYSPLNQRLSLMVRIQNIADADLGAVKSDIESAIQSINTNNGINFELPSDPGQTDITST